MRKSLALSLMLAALAGGARATPVDDVQALGWLAGAWVQQDDKRTVHEVWFAPVDGVMAGLSQTLRPGRKPSIEFMTITAEPDGATFTAHPADQDPTPFVLKPGLGRDEAVFENLDHDFPQRIIYRRCGEDLCARIEGSVKGRFQAQEWRYRPAP
jgi:hypothetical protein